MKARIVGVRHQRTRKRGMRGRRGQVLKKQITKLETNRELFQQSWKYGEEAGRHSSGDIDSMEQQAHLAWHTCWPIISEQLGNYEDVMQAGKAFMQGYAHSSGRSLNIVPMHLHRSAAAVVSACNEEATLAQVIVQLKRLPLTEIVVVLNGTTDHSLERVLDHSRVTLVYEPNRAGHDVGRALGAKVTTAESVLFVDGDMVIAAEQLAPFLYAVDRGDDVALNDLSSLLPAFARQDEVTRMKAYLNRTLGRADLQSNSLTAVPHALSRRMIQAVNPESLVVPPKAQALAIQHGLRVTAPSQVDVIRSNRLRSTNVGSGNPVAKLIIGDHLEAIAEWLNLAGQEVLAPALSRSEVAYRRNT
ncbi:glycosyltransferase family A protein [Paenibacillus xylanexedens]|uniref:glycosyltransferase family A protein n=1 Tax=Paenibacillus xylanexedens TaxID=528191 RepID=UPI0021B4FD46|nr:glycosyltransferase family A protein [Paenibacillus xylanexedens]